MNLAGALGHRATRQALGSTGWSRKREARAGAGRAAWKSGGDGRQPSAERGVQPRRGLQETGAG